MKIKNLFTTKSTNSVALFNMLGPIMLNGINFFTLPIFTRMLNTEDFGIVSVYTSWVAILSILVGLQTQGSIGTAFVHIPEEKRKSYLSSVMSISLLSFLVILVISLLFISPLSVFMELEKKIIVIMVMQALGAFGVTFATTNFTFSKKAFKTFITSLIIALSSALLSVLLIIINKGKPLYLYRIIGMAVPSVLVGVFFIVYFMIKGKTMFSKEHWKFCLPITIPLIFHGLSHIFLSQIARFVIQKNYDFSQVGIYNLIFTFTQVLSILYSALNNTWVPFYYDDLKNNDNTTILKKSKNYLILFTIVTMGFILVSPEVINIFADKRYLSGVSLIPAMAGSVYFTFLYSFPVNFQFFHRKTVAIAIGTMSAAITNFVLATLLTPLWGLHGAAAAMFISYVLLFVFHQIIAHKIIKEPYVYKWSAFLLGALAVTLSAIIFFICSGMWIVRWVIAVILGLLLLLRTIKNKSLF